MKSAALSLVLAASCLAHPGYRSPGEAFCVDGVAPEICEAGRLLDRRKMEAVHERMAVVEARHREEPEHDQNYALDALRIAVAEAEAMQGGRSLSWRNGRPQGAAVELTERARAVLERWKRRPGRTLSFVPGPYLRVMGILSKGDQAAYRRDVRTVLAAAWEIRGAGHPETVALTRSLAWEIFSRNAKFALTLYEEAASEIRGKDARSQVMLAALELDAALVQLTPIHPRYREGMRLTLRALGRLRDTPGIPGSDFDRLMARVGENIERARSHANRLRETMREQIDEVEDVYRELLARGPLPAKPPAPARPAPPPPPERGWLSG